MSEYRHPIRDMKIHVFGRDGATESEGVAFVARFFPYGKFPIFFSGCSAEEVRQKAEDFRKCVIEKNEGAYQKRMVALRKARKAKKKKEKEDDFS